LVGERLAETPGGFSAVARSAAKLGARIAWIPRRAGDRGALDVGPLPNLLPGGRPVSDVGARAELENHWSIGPLPATDGLGTSEILEAARSGSALLIGGVELADLPDPAGAAAAIDSSSFVVSLEIRHSGITDRADVVFPVAPVTEKAGTFVDWEGRPRSFDSAVRGTRSLTDGRVLHALAADMGRPIGLPDVKSAQDEISSLLTWSGAATTVPTWSSVPVPTPAAGEALLATWRMLLDSGRMQDGEPHLAGTARTPVVRLSDATALEIGVSNGDWVTVTSDRGSITLPLTVTDLPDRVVWLPQRSPGSEVNAALGVGNGAIVRIAGVAS
ncbi:MAG: molybdopterin dinucleotide binding domain-containing protein, partial [Rhodococcus sp. (in: high G+C Gram-positive bacteria)]